MNRKIPRRVTLVALAQCRQSEARQEGVPDSSPRRLITPSATGSSMRLTLRVIHKYVSLAVAALWLMQAATGLLLVFHWELDDLSVRGAARALDVERFGAFLERLQAASPDRTVSSVFASGGVHGRFDVLIANKNGRTDVLRVDGEGTVLRERPWDHDYSHVGVFQFATYLHQTLFLHQLGTWFIGLSGILLLSNISLGLSLAWPRGGQWRRALIPARAAAPAAQIYAWHRAAGLWLAVPALVLVFCGVLIAYEQPLASWFDDARRPPSIAAATREPSSPTASAANAVATALRIYPGATLAALELPTTDTPWFAVRVNRVGELRRVFGTTIVYVSGRSGRVLADYDALKSPLKARLWDALYAVHTGEIGGVAGRWLAVLSAVWLLAMICLGLTLWTLRRPRRRRAVPRVPELRKYGGQIRA